MYIYLYVNVYIYIDVYEDTYMSKRFKIWRFFNAFIGLKSLSDLYIYKHIFMNIYVWTYT
jgi:hypothetical protein